MKRQRESRQARYLLRLDDLCPEMDGAKWRRFWPILDRHNLQPILAVIPDNRDSELRVDSPDPDFWDRIRGFQACGAAIGLHGFQHTCHARGRGLMQIHNRSEFVGVPEEKQLSWIKSGMEVLASHGLTATVWVAPRHGFDHVTLKVLRVAGIDTISDGFAEAPFYWREMTWIPQQLWAPTLKKSGIWTICLHPATATDDEVSRLADFLERFGAQFTSVQEVLAQTPIGQRALADRVFHQRMVARRSLSTWKYSLAGIKARLEALKSE